MCVCGVGFRQEDEIKRHATLHRLTQLCSKESDKIDPDQTLLLYLRLLKKRTENKHARLLQVSTLDCNPDLLARMVQAIEVDGECDVGPRGNFKRDPKLYSTAKGLVQSKLDQKSDVINAIDICVADVYDILDIPYERIAK